jgi:hypothetical protein
MAVLGNKYTYWNYDVSRVSYTLAANYKINRENAVYARFPMVSDRRMKKPITIIWQI